MNRPLRVAVAHACPATRALLHAELAVLPDLSVLPADPGAVAALEADVLVAQPRFAGLSPCADLVLVAAPGESGPALDVLLARGPGGLADVVTMPDDDTDGARRAVRAELVPALLGLAAARRPVAWCTPLPGPVGAGRACSATPFTVLALAAGRGGTSAAAALLCTLPPDLPVPVILAQQLPAGWRAPFAERLGQLLRRSGGPAVTGTVTAAGPRAGCVSVVDGGADPLLRMLARTRADGVLAVVMDGLGRDGVQGATAVRAAGGTVLAQDEESSAVWGMPGAVAAAGQADRLVPLGDLAAALTVTLTRHLPPASGRHARPDLALVGS